jgi:hypothetical protein
MNHVTHVQIKNACKMLARNLKVDALGRPMRRCVDNIEMNVINTSVVVLAIFISGFRGIM